MVISSSYGFVPSKQTLTGRDDHQPSSTITSIEVDILPAPVPLSPSSVFGKPITPGTAKFNKAFVNFAKTTIFDSYFDESSLPRNEMLSRSFARFYALETIARMPYFAFLSVLHLYETMGWWRRADYIKMHFSEEWNELHHLLIMESMGGNKKWGDKFLAQHSAFAYFWFIAGCYVFNPTLAYNFNQVVEEHAYHTYDEFLKEFEEELKVIDAPKVAKDYYRDGDLYLFDDMHTCKESLNEASDAPTARRRPKMETLYDTFMAIRDDEAEHVKTMIHLQKQDGDIQLCDVEY